MRLATKLVDGTRVPAWQAFTGRVTHADIQQHGSYAEARAALERAARKERNG